MKAAADCANARRIKKDFIVRSLKLALLCL